MKKIYQISLITIASLFLGGCLSGYQTGTIGHPQINTIAIATVRNQTNRPELRVELQNRLCAAISHDGTYKLKPQDSADCTVYAVIKDVNTQGIGSSYRADDKASDSYEDYGSAIYRFTMKVEYTVLIPGRKKPLVTLAMVSGSSRFTGMGDIEIARQNAAKNAATDAANQIIASITEAW